MKKLIIVAIATLTSLVAQAQIKNAKTETFKVYGNCGMCKKTIEKAIGKSNQAKGVWDKDTKVLTLTYNVKKTTPDVVLKRIALAGYDSETYLAPDDVYAKLPECCKYTRNKKTIAKVDIIKPIAPATTQAMVAPASSLKTVFDTYFLLKDALVQSSGATASAKAKELLMAINTIKMEQLATEEHKVWMKVLLPIKEGAEHIADTKDATQQREYFTSLSTNVYELIKVSKHTETVYYQHCPMYNDGKGANWLSKENSIKNPYYGATMISCGKTIETIK